MRQCRVAVAGDKDGEPWLGRAGDVRDGRRVRMTMAAAV